MLVSYRNYCRDMSLEYSEIKYLFSFKSIISYTINFIEAKL